MPRMMIAAGLLLVLALPSGASAGDVVYRCNNEGVVAFSDRPCGPRPNRHQSSGAISFIAPDDNLPAIAEAAQAFIAQRRRAMAERRRGPSPTPPEQRGAGPATPAGQTMLVPWPVPPRRSPHSRPSRAAVSPELAETIRRNRRYAPIGTSLPGSRSGVPGGSNATAPNRDHGRGKRRRQ